MALRSGYKPDEHPNSSQLRYQTTTYNVTFLLVFQTLVLDIGCIGRCSVLLSSSVTSTINWSWSEKLEVPTWA